MWCSYLHFSSVLAHTHMHDTSASHIKNASILLLRSFHMIHLDVCMSLQRAELQCFPPAPRCAQVKRCNVMLKVQTIPVLTLFGADLLKRSQLLPDNLHDILLPSSWEKKKWKQKSISIHQNVQHNIRNASWHSENNHGILRIRCCLFVYYGKIALLPWKRRYNNHLQ